MESHTGKNRDANGNAREVTPIEAMNQYADWLADWAYEGEQVRELEVIKLEGDDKPTIHMHGQLVTGNWTTQMQEEIRLGNSKQLAGQNKNTWGICPEDISYIIA